MMKSAKLAFVAFTITLLGSAWLLRAQSPAVQIHAGYFPNITHSQSLDGKATGKFDAALAPNATVDSKQCNAGPSVIEALFAGALDVVPIANPDQLTLFMKGEIDGVWAHEPWASRLARDAGGTN